MHAARADLSWAFCGYCGHPPMGRWRSLAHRVCRRCQMGTVLHAPPGLQPRFDEPFVIVDSRLRLQAVSRRGCGLPPAAVLILTPLRTSRTRRSERAQRRPAVADRLTAETPFDPRGGTVTVELTMPPSASPG